MSKYSKRFIVEVHEEMGVVGLRPVNMPGADPLSGMAVVHDILEHHVGDDGGIEDELRALGAAMYVRGDGGFFSIQTPLSPDPEVHIAADFVELARHYEFEEYDLIKCTDDVEPDEWAVSVAKRGARDIRGESQFEPKTAKRFKKRAPKWLQLGYNQARERFGDINPYHLTTAFITAMNYVDEWLERNEWAVGTTLDISVNVEKNVALISGEEDYYE